MTDDRGMEMTLDTKKDVYSVTSSSHTLPQHGSSGELAFATGLLAGAGLALWLYLAQLTKTNLFQLAPGQALPGIIALAILPLFLNGLGRKIFFGSKLSLHQGISFEFIIQLVRWTSPLLPSRRFQAAFQMRETGQERAVALGWQETRFSTFPASAALATTLWMVTSGHTLAASFGLLVSAGAVFWGRKRAQHIGAKLRTYLVTLFTSLALLVAEAVVFAWASHGLLPAHAAMGLWLAVSLLIYRPALPLGLGIVQLPALLLFTSGLAGTAMLLLSTFLLFRLVTLAMLGVLYLSRYKLNLSDLFNQTIVSRIMGSQRPRNGWPASPDLQQSPYTLSLVIPAYQEQRRLPAYLATLRAHLAGKPYLWEIIVVDDGSTDGTLEFIQGEQANDPRIRALRLERNSGKGAAVARGVEESRGRYVIFADADGSTPASETDKLLSALEAGSEIAVGSRVADDPELVRQRKVLRKIMGTVFYRLVNFFAVPGVGDTQCGFKGFRRDVARMLFADLTERRWAFDVEVLYRAQLLGYGITVVPVQWHEVAGSSLKPFVEGTRMARAVFRIRRKNTGFIRQDYQRRTRREAPGAVL